MLNLIKFDIGNMLRVCPRYQHNNNKTSILTQLDMQYIWQLKDNNAYVYVKSVSN